MAKQTNKPKPSDLAPGGQKKRYQISVRDKKTEVKVIGFLKPLTFFVAEAAMGFKMLRFPKLITAGEVLINGLFVEGSKRLQAGGDLYTDAALVAARVLNTIDYKKTGERSYSCTVEDKTYEITLGNPIGRDTLETALGLTAPLNGNPQILSAGRAVIKECYTGGTISLEDLLKAANDEILIPFCYAAYSMIDVRDSELKKV